MEILDAVDGDLPGLLEIYNDVIRTSTAVFTENPVPLDDRHQWWRARVTQGYPVLVAVDDAGIAGFASFGDFRAWPGYRHTVEHSVHVRTDARGTGIGSLLLAELLSRAEALGKHVMVAGIDAANTGSIRFHERHGFSQVGVMQEVGWKFGRWLDLVWMQKRLGPPLS